MLGSTNGKPTIALVIGSGAVKCAAALGLWQVLEREGYPIDMLVGCSGGGLFAATMALGLEPQECIQATQELWDRDITRKRHLPSLLRALLPRIFNFDSSFAMIDDTALRQRLKTVFGDLTFADTRIPLHIVATEFYSGEETILTHGRLWDALRASVAIPYIWSSWQVDGKTLIDGSVSNPMPVDVAIKEGADIILAMGFESPTPSRVKSISRYAFHLNSIMTNNLFQANYAFQNLAHHAEIIPIIPEFDQPVRLFDTHKFPYVIQRGEQAMQAQLPYLERLLSERKAVSSKDGSQ
jgi:NTE family protein